MRKKILLAVLTVALFLVLLPACDAKAQGSLKSLTLPYIAEYECVEARLGEKDLLEKYEYIKITLLDKSEAEVSFKPKDGKKFAFTGEYTVDPETRVLEGEFGILGIRYKEKTTVRNGSFTIIKNLFGSTLYMQFKVK